MYKCNLNPSVFAVYEKWLTSSGLLEYQNPLYRTTERGEKLLAVIDSYLHLLERVKVVEERINRTLHP